MDKFVKQCVFRAISRTGFYHVLKAFDNVCGKRLTIVTYHRVTDRNVDEISNSLNNLFVHVKTFEQQILFFKKNYKIINFNELSGFVENNEIPRNAMLITFDDGYMDFYQHAYPLLREHNIPVTLFIVPGKMGMERGFSFWWDEMFYCMNCLKTLESKGTPCQMPDDISNLFIAFKSDMKSMFDKIMDNCSDSQINVLLNNIRGLTGDDVNADANGNSIVNWDQVREMSDHVEIGSHTMRHRNMKYLSNTELEEEVVGSKMEIEEKLDKKVLAFSYPNGFFNPEIVRHVQMAGYRFAVTTEKGINDGSEFFLMKRVNLWERSSSVFPGMFLEGKLGLKLIGM